MCQNLVTIDLGRLGAEKKEKGKINNRSAKQKSLRHSIAGVWLWQCSPAMMFESILYTEITVYTMLKLINVTYCQPTSTWWVDSKWSLLVDRRLCETFTLCSDFTGVNVCGGWARVEDGLLLRGHWLRLLVTWTYTSSHDTWRMTRHTTHDSWHMTHDTWRMTRHTTHDSWHDTWHMTHDTTHDTWFMTRHMTHDAWHDIWHMIHDTWHTTHDSWHIVEHFSFHKSKQACIE